MDHSVSGRECSQSIRWCGCGTGREGVRTEIIQKGREREREREWEGKLDGWGERKGGGVGRGIDRGSEHGTNDDNVKV